MSRIEHIKWSLAFVHRALRDACNGTTEQIHYVPDFGSHSIAWCLWHTTRVEDMIINGRILGTDLIWNDQWATSIGLPVDGNGNGQSDEDAQNVQIADLGRFIEYQDLVWKSTDDFLSNATDSDLDREVQTRNGTERVDESITLHMLGHFNGHRGEMNFLRGMQGMEPLLQREGTH